MLTATLGVALALAGAPLTERVLLLPLEGDVSLEERAAVEAELRRAAGRVPDVIVEDPEALARALVTMKGLGIECELADVVCLRRVGGFAGVDAVARLTLRPAELAREVEVVHVDVASGEERGAVVKVSTTPKPRVEDAYAVAVAALAPREYRGSVRVMAPDGAVIVVDGVPRVAPLAAPIAVTPGAVRVEVLLDGHRAHEQVVTVAFRETFELDVTLEPGEAPSVAARFGAVPAHEPPPAQVPSPARAEGPRVVRVAVYEPDVTGVDLRVTRIVYQSVLAEVRKLQHVSVIGVDEIRAMLDHESQKQLMGCEADESCLAQIADALGVDVVVIGSIARLDDQHVFGMKKIDQASAETAASFLERVEAGSGEELLALVGPAVEKLFPDVPLIPGKERGVSPEMVVRLSPPPLPAWVFWTTAAATSASGLFTLALGGAFGFLQLDYTSTWQGSGEGAPVSGALLKSKGDAVVVANLAMWIAAGATGVLAAASGLEALFTDWQGYGDEQE